MQRKYLANQSLGNVLLSGVTSCHVTCHVTSCHVGATKGARGGFYITWIQRYSSSV